MNAAVSLAMCMFGRLAWKMLPVYVFAQFLGSFLAAATIYTVFNGKDRCSHSLLYCCWINCSWIELLPSTLSIPDAIFDFGDGNLTTTGAKATAGIFATYPAPYLSLQSGFIDQVDLCTPVLYCTEHTVLTGRAHSIMNRFVIVRVGWARILGGVVAG